MKKLLFVLLIISSITDNTACGWGFYGHQHIAKGAIFALPAQPGTFFYNHYDFLTEEAVIPDLRKYVINDKNEPYRHYIDWEGYGNMVAGDMPQTMKDAIARYGEDTLKKYGILPWYIQDMMAKLTTAFKEKNKDEILFIAGELSHYVADAYMPLHTSLYYDGQKTNQRGIHAFWESQLPELFGDTYNLHTREAKYIQDIPANTWAIIANSHSLIDTLLIKEQKLKKEYADIMYEKDANGKPVVNRFKEPIHAYEYAKLYHTALNGMVEQQMRAAETAVADYWYTAWVNAGKPDLSNLDAPIITQRNKAFYKEDMQTWQKGKVPGIKTTSEFKNK